MNLGPNGKTVSGDQVRTETASYTSQEMVAIGIMTGA